MILGNVGRKVLSSAFDLIVVEVVRQQKMRLDSTTNPGCHAESYLLSRVNRIVVQDYVDILRFPIVQH